MSTMDEVYDDGSDHACCPQCGLCIDCQDCQCQWPSMWTKFGEGHEGMLRQQLWEKNATPQQRELAELCFKTMQEEIDKEIVDMIVREAERMGLK